MSTFLAAIAFGLQSQSSVLAQGTGPVDLSVPDSVAVALEPDSTAFLVIDLLESTCSPNPSCMATVPVVATGLSAARSANALVVYSVHLAPDNNILDDVAPMSNDPVFAAVPGDKFFDSNLDYILRQAGITTLVLSGISSNSGVMYTAAAAIQRGYKVVVVDDGISAATDLATSVALWQLLHGPGANPQNVPLQARAVTLSRIELITYKTPTAATSLSHRHDFAHD